MSVGIAKLTSSGIKLNKQVIDLLRMECGCAINAVFALISLLRSPPNGELGVSGLYLPKWGSGMIGIADSIESFAGLKPEVP